MLDPLSAYIGDGTSMNSANDVRRHFRPLIDIAKEQGCAILIVHHMNKAMGQKALHRAVGSVDVAAAARSVLMVARTDKEETPMANYAIMRIAKRKLGSVSRLCNHHERLKKEYKSNPDIDVGRSYKNYHLIEPTDKYRKMILSRIEEVGAKQRKDSVVMQDCFVGATPDWIKAKTPEEQEEYFRYALDFFEKNFGKQNILSAVVHMDEATPHMHLCFVPITEKGRLSSKEIIGGPQGLVKWQDKFYEHMFEKYPDITRGTPARLTHRKHIPPYMFKVAGKLYGHYEEICKAINDIGLMNNAKKKDAAIALIGRYAPEMVQLKKQLESTDRHIAYLV